MPDVAATGGKWPRSGGPRFATVCSTGTGLFRELPEGGPSLLWRVDGICDGISCASIVEGRSYATGFHEQEGC